MKKSKNSPASATFTLPKSPTGIDSLDEITEGGFPKGRPTLLCGSAGCGKTLMGMEFLIRGISEFDEPGVFMAFEETAEELAANVASLGFDLPSLVAQKKLKLDYVHVDRTEIEETGQYDLEGLLSGSVMPLTPSVPNASYWTPSNRFFRACPTRPFCGRS